MRMNEKRGSGLALISGVVTGMQMTALSPSFFEESATPCGVEGATHGATQSSAQPGASANDGCARRSAAGPRERQR